ncbi:hypothetical protein SCHPADRAFT_625719 [Schizopora paradoxa]|uniref:Uncharacterized protein n=1 Tax=Schizopora paradoxa TaxID=27342 RepID=A0A0H2R9C2_9AGAM|nr:hypothetical protein SCHPADRAFT_625719 [Schizopora paradoxa]
MRHSAPSSSRSPVSTMSQFASNLASLARSKLHSGLSSGSRDNLSLHRWVLLKNSIIRDDSAPPTPTEEERELSAPSLVPDAPDAEDEDEDDSFNDEGAFFNFLFPDPGYGAEAQRDAATIATEEQWFDSLLETLGDDDEDDANHHHNHLHISSAGKLIAPSTSFSDHLYHSDVQSPPSSDPASPASSYSDEYSLASPPPPPLQSIAVPYPVPYPPLVKPYGAAAAHDDAEADDELCCYAPRARPAAAAASVVPYFLPYNDLEDSYLSMPDAMEDSASDDDTEPLPATPFSRSRSSFSLSVSDVAVDPASVPLPLESDHRARGRPSVGSEPRIYSSAADDVFAFDPNPVMSSDAAPVYSPFFFQNC